MLAVSLKDDVKAAQAVLQYVCDPTVALINLALYLLSLVFSKKDVFI